MSRPVVQHCVIADTEHLTLYCPVCRELHTFAVQRKGETLPYSAKRNFPIWTWNGSTTQPTIEGRCIKTGRCHLSVGRGMLLAPVESWPLLITRSKRTKRTRERSRQHQMDLQHQQASRFGEALQRQITRNQQRAQQKGEPKWRTSPPPQNPTTHTPTTTQP